MSLLVLEPGLYSLLVDGGRPHTRSYGVPVGGAADRAALALGNALVGNASFTPALELTLNGPTLSAACPVSCVLFGAPFNVSVNGTSVNVGTTFTIHADDELKIGGTPRGARGYLCVAGGFQSAPVMGSRSALAPVKIGDVLKCRPSFIRGRSLPFVSARGLATDDNAVVLRVLEGPQRDWFAGETFLTSTYEVTPASNRMGLRLRGEVLVRRAGELVSEAVAPGAIQVANDGQPIVLGVDGQTIGGYPKIAHVIRADLDHLAQLRPGARVRFQHVSMEQADEIAIERAKFLHEWLVRLNAAEGGPDFGDDE